MSKIKGSKGPKVTKVTKKQGRRRGFSWEDYERAGAGRDPAAKVAARLGVQAQSVYYAIRNLRPRRARAVRDPAPAVARMAEDFKAVFEARVREGVEARIEEMRPRLELEARERAVIELALIGGEGQRGAAALLKTDEDRLRGRMRRLGIPGRPASP